MFYSIVLFLGTISNIEAGTQWVLGNVKQTFYYRVNYNQENWEALINVLLTDHTVNVNPFITMLAPVYNPTLQVIGFQIPGTQQVKF